MVTYKSLKTKEKSRWVIPKVVALAYRSGRLRELFITKFKGQFKRGFKKLVARRASTVFKNFQNLTNKIIRKGLFN